MPTCSLIDSPRVGGGGGGGGVVFGKDGGPTVTTFSGNIAATNVSHTFTSDTNTLTLMVAGEMVNTSAITSVVIDPAGAAIAMSVLVAKTGGTGIFLAWAYEAHGISGLSGAKTVRITWSGGNLAADGRVQTQGYKGAANAAPTPTDSDTSTSATSLTQSLTAGDADGILQCCAVVNNDQTISASGCTITDQATSVSAGGGAAGGWAVAFAEKVGSLGAEAPQLSWPSSQACSMVGFIVNPA